MEGGEFAENISNIVRHILSDGGSFKYEIYNTTKK